MDEDLFLIPSSLVDQSNATPLQEPPLHLPLFIMKQASSHAANFDFEDLANTRKLQECS